MNDIKAFVNNMLLHEQDPAPMELDDAIANMICWDADGVEMPDGMTAGELCEAWNSAIDELS